MKFATPPAHHLAIYGMTVDDWQKLGDAQEWKCLLCHKPFTALRPPHNDHNHLTGDMRGLLCGHCNEQLGYMHDDAAWCWRAWDYLTEPFADSVFATPRRHRDAAPPEEVQRPIVFGGVELPTIQKEAP